MVMSPRWGFNSRFKIQNSIFKIHFLIQNSIFICGFDFAQVGMGKLPQSDFKGLHYLLWKKWILRFAQKDTGYG